MILLAITGGLVVLWLYQRQPQQAAGSQLPRRQMGAVAGEARTTAPVPSRIFIVPNPIINRPVAPVTVAPLITNYGTPALAPQSFDTRFVPTANTRAADAAAGLGVAQNLQIAVGVERAQGNYTGYGVPLSGPGLFSPLLFDDSGYIIDSGSIGFSGGPLAG